MLFNSITLRLHGYDGWDKTKSGLGRASRGILKKVAGLLMLHIPSFLKIL